ncbi:hypothetical protein PYCCODRAFT_1422698 [Trametes coccinea BRFM310]|uniref:Uncharacterized protein n=1 Tax=Trametes coccinea (strain BRFM310) TaxID=1353009 RepID=A0A1Y2IZ90_TRAC3|nr:hypothetical protein PYCCODRAFT_1422698 [Trametes coccinea BRFM310]
MIPQQLLYLLFANFAGIRAKLSYGSLQSVVEFDNLNFEHRRYIRRCNVQVAPVYATAKAFANDSFKRDGQKKPPLSSDIPALGYHPIGIAVRFEWLEGNSMDIG